MKPEGKAQHDTKHSHNPKKGVACVLAGWLFLTTVIAISRYAGEATSVPTVLFFQNLVSLIVITPWMIVHGGNSLKLSRFALIVLRSLAGYTSFAFIFLAVQRTTLVNVVLLSNSAPLFIPLIIWLWKKVKISKRLWIGLIIGFVGIAFILKPDETIADMGALFAIGAAICFSISMITQRRLVKRETLSTILFYYFLISTILSIPFAIDTWKPIDLKMLLILITIGILFVSGQTVFLKSFRYEKPSFLSPFVYSSVVYGALIDWMFWQQIPDWTTILGIIIVCTGGIITMRANGSIRPH